MFSSDNDGLISQFMAFTGCVDGDRAQQYLEMANLNVETAVGLFMEHQHQGNTSASSQIGDALNDVRAPDRTRTMRLMDDVMTANHHFAEMDDQDIVMNAFSNVDARAAVNAAVAVAASADDASSKDNDQEAKSEDVAGSLSTMFAAPSHLIHKGGGFQGARAVAKDARRWLLVNLQSDSEFSCHALNRDVWRDELVENLIREGFIFWQAMDDSQDGRTYAERYKVFEFPHIAIIDPRTGRSMWKKEGWNQVKPFTSENFAEMAMDFCSRHSFDKEPLPPPKKSTISNNANGERKRPFMNESEHMKVAMAASLRNSNEDIDNDEDEYIMEDDDDGKEVQCLGTQKQTIEEKQQTIEEKKQTSIQRLLSIIVGDEPAAGARIQLRMPDATKLIRKFETNDDVNTIYAFVAQNNEEAKKGKEFMLMAGFPPKSLMGDINKSIESCGLNGQAVTVRWKD